LKWIYESGLLMANHTIDAATLREWLADGAELAVLDIRPADEVGYVSPLVVANLPADDVLADIDRFVPRKQVRTVLADGGDGVAVQLATALAEDGRDQTYALDGGIPAWAEQGEGLPVFAVNPTAFSDIIQADRDTPGISVPALRSLRADGADVVLFDTRRLFEYEAGHIPGAIAVPGSELLLRFSELVSSPDTHIVTYCADLTRGVPNPVYYLDRGTRAWREDGQELETGATQVFGPVDAADRRAAAERAQTLLKEDEFPYIDLETAAGWAKDSDRTTYLVDIRTPEEYQAGHVPGSISTDGARLVGGTFRTLAVRGARVVLIDDPTGARAAAVAPWLQRRGHEIALLLLDFDAQVQGAAVQ
jgi:rhodanese-related sulfurtransferase